MPKRRLALTLLAAVAVVNVPLPASAAPRSDPQSLSDLQAARDANRTQQAAQASEVDTLKATVAQLKAALAALDAEVSAQQDRVEEAERAHTQAEADRVAAEKAVVDAETQLASLGAEVKKSAVEAYLNAGSSDALSSIGSADVNETVNKKALLDVRAKEHLDLIEKFRSVQEDLAAQRVAKADAEQRAKAQADEVKARKKELDAAYAKQKEFADSVDLRLSQELAKAAQLASTDKNLADQIQSKQTEIAKALAAEQTAAAARAAQRAAANKGALVQSRPSAQGGAADTPDPTASPITSAPQGGSIVNAGYGIEVHSSIGGQVKALLTAAHAAGINLGGSGFRSPSQQIALRIQNCGSSTYAIYQAGPGSCSPPTAIPGSSMHEQGLAIDFEQDGVSLGRGTSGYAWLSANAASYGLYNLPSESWHWSTTGR